MVVGWLVKVVVILAVLGLAVVELGSPLVARAQADDAVHEVANEAALTYGSSAAVKQMEQRCAEVAEQKDVSLQRCQLINGQVEVTVQKEAYSLILHKIGPLEGWYQVKASASATPK